MFLSFKDMSYIRKLKLRAIQRDEDARIDRLADKIADRLKKRENG